MVLEGTVFCLSLEARLWAREHNERERREKEREGTATKSKDTRD